jgi:hypothetical protein
MKVTQHNSSCELPLAALRALTAKHFRNWCRLNPDFLWSFGGATELHAAFREESRTSLLSTGAALQEIREAIDIFVVFLQEKPHLAIFVRPQ